MTCVAETWSRCVPIARKDVCNGLDDDCNGHIDDGGTNECGGSCALASKPGEWCASNDSCTHGLFRCDGLNATSCGPDTRGSVRWVGAWYGSGGLIDSGVHVDGAGFVGFARTRGSFHYLLGSSNTIVPAGEEPAVMMFRLDPSGELGVTTAVGDFEVLDFAPLKGVVHLLFRALNEGPSWFEGSDGPLALEPHALYAGVLTTSGRVLTVRRLLGSAMWMGLSSMAWGPHSSVLAVTFYAGIVVDPDTPSERVLADESEKGVAILRLDESAGVMDWRILENATYATVATRADELAVAYQGIAVIGPAGRELPPTPGTSWLLLLDSAGSASFRYIRPPAFHATFLGEGSLAVGGQDFYDVTQPDGSELHVGGWGSGPTFMALAADGTVDWWRKYSGGYVNGIAVTADGLAVSGTYGGDLLGMPIVLGAGEPEEATFNPDRWVTFLASHSREGDLRWAQLAPAGGQVESLSDGGLALTGIMRPGGTFGRCDRILPLTVPTTRAGFVATYDP